MSSVCTSDAAASEGSPVGASAHLTTTDHAPGQFGPGPPAVASWLAIAMCLTAMPAAAPKSLLPAGDMKSSLAAFDVYPPTANGTCVGSAPGDQAARWLSGKQPRAARLRRTDPMTPITIAQLRARSTVDLMTAACALGLGRTKAYELARHEEFPCRVIRIGDTYRVPTAGLLELLGVSAEEPRAAAEAAR
jgi:hypothetical protein